MKNIKKILIAGVIGIIVTSSVGCNMVAKTPEAIKNTPVAKVNGETITKGQLDLRVQPAKASFAQQYGADWEKNPQYKQSFEDQRKQERQRMIDEIVILQHAKTAKVMPTTKDVDAAVKIQLDATIKQVGDETKFAEALKPYGFTKESYTTFLKSNVTVSKAEEGLLKNLKIEDAKVQAEYDSNKTIKYTTKPSLIHIQRILSASEADSKAVVARINKNEDFATVAKAVSTDTATKANGGDLGDYYYDETKNQSPLDPVFVKAAMAVELNKISAPVKTQEGFYVIKITKKEVYPAAAFATVKEAIKASLLNQFKKQTITADLKKWEADLGKKIILYDKNM